MKDQINGGGCLMYQEMAEVELKRELTDLIKNEIVAFLNTRNGTIYVGVQDNGKIYEEFQKVDKDEVDTKISNWLEVAIYPLPFGLVKHYFNEDGVLVIEVKEGKDKPYYLRSKGPRPSGVYKRVGRSIRKANEDEILRMIMTSRNYVYEDEVSDEQSLTFDYLKQAFKQKNIKLTKRNMISLGITNSNGEYTNLGHMLSDQSDVVVKVAEYDKYRNFKIKKIFSGSLVKVFFDVKEQADRLNDVSATINIKTFMRDEIISYPEVALREMILNAFIHADYFIRSNIKVEFFPDHCRIMSPGGVYNTTLEEIMNGTQTYRNHKLVNVFYKLGLIENFGTGIPRTLDAYANETKKPEFEASDNFFYVTLPNLNYKEEETKEDESHKTLDRSLSEMDLMILEVIAQNPGIKVSGIQEEMKKKGKDISLDIIRNSIKRKIYRYIEYRGSKKTGGYYYISD